MLLGRSRPGTRSAKAIESGTDKDREIPTSIYAMESLCLTGHKDHPAVVKSLQWRLDRPDEYLGPFKGCPWSPDVMVKAMWSCRNAADTAAYCEKSLRWIADNVNDAGCITYKDPWGFVDCAGLADTPASRDLVVRMIPLILRAQGLTAAGATAACRSSAPRQDGAP